MRWQCVIKYSEATYIVSFEIDAPDAEEAQALAEQVIYDHYEGAKLLEVNELPLTL
jgi:hypothetical protein